MKIKYNMSLLMKTAEYCNTSINFEAGADTTNESDMKDLDHIAKAQGLKVRDINDYSEVLRNFVEGEVMSMRSNLELHSLQDFKLKV